MQMLSKEKQIDIVLLILRITFGGSLIIGHGWGKLMRLFSGAQIEFGDPYGIGPTASLILATFAEFLCSVLIVLGLFTRWAVIPLIITMLTVVFLVHFGDPYNRVEAGILFLMPFIAILIGGPGRYSLDAIWRKEE